METSTEFAQILKKLRDEFNLSQDQLAEACGFQTSYVSKIERGAHTPNLKTIDKIAESFNMSTIDLLAYSKKYSKKPKIDPITFKIMVISKSLSEEKRLHLLDIAGTFEKR